MSNAPMSVPPPEQSLTMAGKTCLVTGATSGIGEVAALELARKGARVVLVGRSREKAEATLDRIRRDSGNPAVEYLLADLSVQDEVRRLAQGVKASYPRIDVLVNNAGAMFQPRREGADGIEMTWALNHLGYFLLTNLLLDNLKAAGPARVVSVASDAHRFARGIDFDDVEGKKKYSAFGRYCQSKLANVLFSRELARRLQGTGVTSNSLHPGFVATNFTAGEGWTYWVMKQMAKVMAITPEDGAKTTIYLASSPEVDGVSGKYFTKCRDTPPNKPAMDDEAARKLWELSERMTGMVG